MANLLHEAWKHELRDAHGLWIKSGHAVSFQFTNDKGKVVTAHGTFLDSQEPGVARIAVKANTSKSPLKSGVYRVDHKWVTAVKAVIPEYQNTDKQKNPASVRDRALKETVKHSKELHLQAHEINQNDIVQQAGMSNFGKVEKVTHNKDTGETNIHVRWINNKSDVITVPSSKKLKIWRSNNEPVENALTKNVEGEQLKPVEPNKPIELNESRIATDLDKNQLTDQQKRSINWYTGDGYMGMTNHLRKGQDVSPEEKRAVADLLHLIESSKTTKDCILYRGRAVVNEDRVKELKSLKIGDTITDPGIQSTTDDFDKADFFARMMEDAVPGHKDYKNQVKGRFMFKINLPQGSKAFQIPNELSDYNDTETLIPPHVPLTVKNIEDKDGLRYIEFDAHPPK